MKKLIFGCALACASVFTLPAMAQEGCCPCYEADFDGFYFGGNIGAISHAPMRSDLDGFLSDKSEWTIVNTDVTLGVQLGYDWRCNYRVLGLVADWNWSNVSGKIQEDASDPDDDDFFKTDLNWFTTIRGRGGLSVCDTLIYVTMGAAVADFKTRWNNNDDGSTTINETRWGWVGGVGAEFMAKCNFSIGAELLYMGFSQRDYSRVIDTETVAFDHSDAAWVGRLVVNYRFGDLCNWCCN